MSALRRGWRGAAQGLVTTGLVAAAVAAVLDLAPRAAEPVRWRARLTPLGRHMAGCPVCRAAGPRPLAAWLAACPEARRLDRERRRIANGKQEGD